MLRKSLLGSCLLPILFLSQLAPAPAYQYIRIGSPHDLQTSPVGGVALMGGGSDLDEAFRWLCNKSNGGDFLVLRAAGGAVILTTVRKSLREVS